MRSYRSEKLEGAGGGFPWSGGSYRAWSGKIWYSIIPIVLEGPLVGGGGGQGGDLERSEFNSPEDTLRQYIRDIVPGALRGGRDGGRAARASQRASRISCLWGKR